MAKQRFGINDAYRGTVGTVIGYEWRGKWCLRARPLRVHNPRTEKQQSNRMLFKQAVDLASHMKLALRKGLHNVSMGLHITECNLFVKRNKGCFSLDESGRMPAGSRRSKGEEQGQRMLVDWERLIISEGSVAVPEFAVPEPGLLSSTHSSVSPGRAASSPNLGEQPDSNSADGGGGSSSPSKLEGVDAKRTGACVSYPVSDITFPFSPCGEGEKACGDDEVYVYAYCPEAAEGVLSAPAWRRGGSVRLTLPERWQGKEVHFYGFAVDLDGEASETVYIGVMERTEVRNEAHEECREETDGAGEDLSVPAQRAGLLQWRWVSDASWGALPEMNDFG
ncbi:MAG: hypothetical protein IJR04_02725 [Bacteroidales bacterium]|nr:hypothetical protein [Bacteroidales bacterium]